LGLFLPFGLLLPNMQRKSLRCNSDERPILNNSIAPIQEFHLAKIIERVLKLSTVSLISWLAGFFCIFHSTLNALAELMRFGDRKFYDAWWNSGSLGTYWRLWNLPVHNYFKRHVYVPLRRRGWTNMNASLVVFTLSAVLHEVLLGIPTHAVSRAQNLVDCS
jgi:diacylglycerol O-acyltransferase 1